MTARRLPAAAALALAASVLAPTPGRAAGFGRDLGAAQRGLAVYGRACASCHGLVSLRPVDLVGLGLSPDQIRAWLRAQSRSPFAPGAAPDLSRELRVLPGGAASLRRILAADPVPPSAPRAYKEEEAAHRAAMRMASPVFTDGTAPSVAERAADIAAFLDWAADPHRTARRRLALEVALWGGILILLASLLARRNHG